MKNSDTTSWHKLLRQLDQFSSFYTKFQAVMKWFQMHPITAKHTKEGVYGPIGWIGCVPCEKFRLIALVQLVLQQISCSNETIPNASKHSKTHQIMGLGFNGLDWERSMWKIVTRIRGTNFCTNCTSLARFAPSFMQQRNDPKCTQTLQNAQKH